MTMNERPDDRATPPTDQDSGLADDELRVLGVTASASVPVSMPPKGLRDRILALARDRHFSFIRDREGVWLPRADAPVATKALFHDSRDRLTTRLVRLVPGAELPAPELAGSRSVYILHGIIAAGEMALGAGDFADHLDPSRRWSAAEATLLLDMEDVADPPDPTRVARAADAQWLEPFEKGKARILAADHASGREFCVLQMEPGAILAEHEHRGVEELFIIRGSCEVEGQWMEAGDYHRAVLGSAHDLTRAHEEGCAAFVVLRDPSRFAA